MAHLMIPDSTSDKIALFRQAATQIDKMTEEKQIEIHPNLAVRLRRQAELLEHVQQGQATLRQTRVPLRETERLRYPELKLLIRHFYAALKNRIRREPRGVALNALFELSGQAIENARDRPRRLLALAQQIIEREALAVSQGFAPHTNPSASELEPWLQGAREAREQLDLLSRRLKEGAQRRKELNEQSYLLARELLARLKAEFIHHSYATQRELIRTFGFKATYPSKESEPDSDSEATTGKTKAS